MNQTPGDARSHRLEFEAKTVARIAESVKAALNWNARPDLQVQKAAALRLLASDYVRHLINLLGLEEKSERAAADQELEGHFELTARKHELGEERQDLQKEARSVAERFTGDEQWDPQTFALASSALRTLLQHAAWHNFGEIDLLQEMWDQDTGGGD